MADLSQHCEGEMDAFGGVHFNSCPSAAKREVIDHLRDALAEAENDNIDAALLFAVRAKEAWEEAQGAS